MWPKPRRTPGGYARLLAPGGGWALSLAGGPASPLGISIFGASRGPTLRARSPARSPFLPWGALAFARKSLRGQVGPPAGTASSGRGPGGDPQERTGTTGGGALRPRPVSGGGFWAGALGAEGTPRGRIPGKVSLVEALPGGGLPSSSRATCSLKPSASDAEQLRLPASGRQGGAVVSPCVCLPVAPAVHSRSLCRGKCAGPRRTPRADGTGWSGCLCLQEEWPEPRGTPPQPGCWTPPGLSRRAGGPTHSPGAEPSALGPQPAPLTQPPGLVWVVPWEEGEPAGLPGTHGERTWGRVDVGTWSGHQASRAALGWGLGARPGLTLGVLRLARQPCDSYCLRLTPHSTPPEPDSLRAWVGRAQRKWFVPSWGVAGAQGPGSAWREACRGGRGRRVSDHNQLLTQWLLNLKLPGCTQGPGWRGPSS